MELTLFLLLEGEPEISLFGFRKFNGSEWNALDDIRPNVTLKPVTVHTAFLPCHVGSVYKPQTTF